MTSSQQRNRKRVAPSSASLTGPQLSATANHSIDVHWSISDSPLTKAQLDQLGLCTEIVVGCGFEASVDSGEAPTLALNTKPGTLMATAAGQSK